MPVSSCFRTPFTSKRIHGSQTLLEPALQHFHPNSTLIQDELSLKTYLLVRYEIFGLFGNTLTADHMYSLHRWENLPQHVLTLLSQNRITFSQIFIMFSESTQKFACFRNEDQPHSLNILEVFHPDICGSFNAHKLLFQNTLRQ